MVRLPISSRLLRRLARSCLVVLATVIIIKIPTLELSGGSHLPLSWVGLPREDNAVARRAVLSRDASRRERVSMQAEKGPARFSKQRLAAETDDYFGKPRLLLFGFIVASAGIGLLTEIPRLIGTVFKAPNALPLEKVLQDGGINLAGVLIGAVLFQRQLDQEASGVRVKEAGALIAKLPVRLPIAKKEGDDAYPTVEIKLGDVRAERKRRARRPIICIGGPEFCQQCVETSAGIAKAMDRADILVVPMSTDRSKGQELVEASKNLRYVALASEGSKRWRELCEMELKQAEEQGLDIDAGLVVVIKKNGRVAMRFIGVPNWETIAKEVNDRDGGLDTSLLR